MATQRLTVATLAGDAAAAVAALFESWRLDPDPAAVDQFCTNLRENVMSLPVVYFCEWVDRWLMGDQIVGADGAEGRQYHAACLSPKQAEALAGRCGNQFQEQQWLAARLREAAAGWGTVAERYVVVVIRQVVGPSTTDDEVKLSLKSVPAWLDSSRGRPETRTS